MSKLATKINEYLLALRGTSVVVIDTETTLINKDKFTSIYTHPPKFVMAGWRSSTAVHPMTTTDLSHFEACMDFYLNTPPAYVIVGHNVMYDILQVPGAIHNPNLMVWDTGLAEYLLSHQRTHTPSLNELGETYEIGQKESTVSEKIKKGICPSTMERGELEEYLIQDVNMTWEIYQKQREKVRTSSINWQRMFASQMIYLVNTTRASLNGMAINRESAEIAEKVIEVEARRLEEHLKTVMSYVGVHANDDFWNPSSNAHVAAVLYGGDLIDSTGKDVVGTYKTGPKAGTPKTVTRHEKFTAPGIEELKVLGPSVDEETLRAALKITGSGRPVSVFLENLIEHRELKKELSTYYQGYIPYSYHDGLIHPTFNHTVTPTGRVSVCKPNLQNIKSAKDE